MEHRLLLMFMLCFCLSPLALGSEASGCVPDSTGSCSDSTTLLQSQVNLDEYKEDSLSEVQESKNDEDDEGDEKDVEKDGDSEEDDSTTDQEEKDEGQDEEKDEE